MARMALRTPSGNPSEAAREKYGNAQGKFPIFDQHSAESAIRLRGHSDNPNGVLARASSWANAHDDSAVKSMIQRARQ